MPMPLVFEVEELESIVLLLPVTRIPAWVPPPAALLLLQLLPIREQLLVAVIPFTRLLRARHPSTVLPSSTVIPDVPFDRLLQLVILQAVPVLIPLGEPDC